MQVLRSQGNSRCHNVAFASFHSTPNRFLFTFTLNFRMSYFPTRGSTLAAPLPFIPLFFNLCRHGCGTLSSTSPPSAASHRLRFDFSFFLSFLLSFFWFPLRRFCTAPVSNAICIYKQEGARSAAARRETMLMHTWQQRGVYSERRWQAFRALTHFDSLVSHGSCRRSQAPHLLRNRNLSRSFRRRNETFSPRCVYASCLWTFSAVRDALTFDLDKLRLVFLTLRVTSRDADAEVLLTSQQWTVALRLFARWMVLLHV